MKKHKLTAKVLYSKRENGSEGYSVQILLQSGEWAEDSFFPLIPREGSTEKNFVHWSILKKIAELHNIGYAVELPW